MLTKTHVITARGPGEVEQTAHVYPKDSMTAFSYPILSLGIANPARMINANNVKLLTKTHVILVKEPEDQALSVHAQPTGSTILLFLLIHLHGIAEPVAMINANNANW